MRTVEAPPNPSALIESMRDIGYSLGTALADLIDNSISAGSRTIRIFAEATESPFRVGVLDDGAGMDQTTLLNAMKLGSQSPSEERDRSDLGRFGLGLKTASFSQCRSLTVLTRQGGIEFAAKWDLDFVAETNQWLVQLPTDFGEIPWAHELSDSGTLVVWEKLATESEAGRQHASDLVRMFDEARSHLELVFHRFLAGEPGLKKVRILLNERPLVPFDPFHASHPATMVGPEERIRFKGSDVIVRAFTLPHRSKVSGPDWERNAGQAGYLRNQGFYVYRERRLIIYGTWFGLARQSELTKLARVRVDMPNTLDSAWKIDIKKASAQLPSPIRRRLVKIIDPLGAASKRVYTTRGRRLLDKNPVPVWSRFQQGDEIAYRINDQHPTVMDLISRMDLENKADLLNLLEIAGSALPMDAIFADIAGSQDIEGNANTSGGALYYAAITTFNYLIATGRSVTDALDTMRETDPFRSNWEETNSILAAEINETNTPHREQR
ncbi:MAG: ATP-binding protein [Chloroflexi bacterium]|nr:ATP-binding protein [Chloroflexota bacterium]